MFEITPYTPEQKSRWNDFVHRSKNSTFLHNRDYMDYHADRFDDASLLVWQKGRLAALLPFNRGADGRVVSHGGLTYGGLLLDYRATAENVCEMFAQINKSLKSMGVIGVIYKPVPQIYHLMPAEEDLYAIFNCCNARLVRREISSTIAQQVPIRFVESRQSGLRKARNREISIQQSTNYAAFWDILSKNLADRYNTVPVHSLAEICRLAEAFPANIKLYMAYQNEMPLGGTVVYETPQVVHTQYISASPVGKQLGALDLLFHRLVREVYKDVPYFDFGTSTIDGGNGLNPSLIFQKEGFGGRGICYDTYEWDL